MNFDNVVNKKLGYYQVFDSTNPTAYGSKTQALLHATRANTWIEWNFNQEVFAGLDWTQEPTESLEELYRQRAQQLRDSYDYLVLNYSGGSDSKNILDICLKHNIQIDEILVRWPRKASENIYTPNGYDYVPENVYSEWDLVILPDLKWIASQHPEIKISVYDYTPDVEGFYQDEEWITKVIGDHLNPAQMGRFSMGMTQHRRVLDRGYRIAHVFGVDKPRVAHENGKYYAFFLDTVANLGSMPFDETVDNNNVQELFYWTPDFPKVVIKQAHIIANFFKAHPMFLHLIPKGFVPYSSRTAYEMIIKSLIYPTWDPTRFQAPKPSSVFFCEYDEWFFNSFKDTKAMQVWDSGLKYATSHIDAKHFNINRHNQAHGFVGCVSPHFEIF